MKKSMWAFIQEQVRRAIPPVATADLTGKTVIVTGANTGLGFEAAKHFARMSPGKLILACRNKEKGKSAVSKIVEETGFTPELWLLDLAKFSSVIDFANRFESDGGRLDILLANAAIATEDYKLTSDGWEETLQVNDLSTSLLCLLLAPRLVETAKNNVGTNPRIVVVSSEVHYWATFDEDVFDAPSSFRVISSEDYCVSRKKMSSRYFDSKLLNVFFTRSLSELLKNTPIIVDTVNPGYCYSELRREYSGIRAWFDYFMEKALARTQEEGARQLVYAAVGCSENPDEMRGVYVNLHGSEDPSDYVLGEDGKKRQDKLWADLIDELTKVDGRVTDIMSSFSS